ncbi:MAG: hypothetical protein AAB316_14695 [Bacteroidota bacterium]
MKIYRGHSLRADAETLFVEDARHEFFHRFMHEKREFEILSAAKRHRPIFPVGAKTIAKNQVSVKSLKCLPSIG